MKHISEKTHKLIARMVRIGSDVKSIAMVVGKDPVIIQSFVETDLECIKAKNNRAMSIKYPVHRVKGVDVGEPIAGDDNKLKSGRKDGMYRNDVVAKIAKRKVVVAEKRQTQKTIRKNKARVKADQRELAKTIDEKIADFYEIYVDRSGEPTRGNRLPKGIKAEAALLFAHASMVSKLPVAFIASTNLQKNAVRARAYVVHELSRRYPTASYMQLARMTMRKDHTGVINLIKNQERTLEIERKTGRDHGSRCFYMASGEAKRECNVA